MRCIFYIPYKLEEKGTGARMIRPRKMIQAFRDIGYEVYVIEGVSSKRRSLIKELKRNINRGIKYDFMYAESHTEPTLLTDPHHFPTHPFLDYSFFRFVRNEGIKIGLFYCDIYWKFNEYGAELPKWKKCAAILNYKYDIRQYKKYLTTFYVADIRVCDYLNCKKLSCIAKELPPGSESVSAEPIKYGNAQYNNNQLRIFYVGGLGNHYSILELVKAVNEVDKCSLTICCREKEWNKVKNLFSPYLNARIAIVHKGNDELEPYFKNADICSLLFERGVYMDMAKPFKAYEYLAYEKPIIATKGTAIGQFVEENDIGWSIDYNLQDIKQTLERIILNPEEIERKIAHCHHTKTMNLWTERAKTVEKDLVNRRLPL